MPTVTSVTPTTGRTTGGTALTITGTGFIGGATVSIGAVNAGNVVVVSATSITCTTSPRAAGLVSVTVTNPDATTGTLPDAFTYADPSPAPTSISPTYGGTAGNTSVTIIGTEFGAGATVKFGGLDATNVGVAATSITCRTPAHAGGLCDVVVTNPDAQTGTLFAAFDFSDPPPVPTAVNPAIGPTAGGTTVTIAGTGFVAGATVKIGGINATNVTVNSAHSITCTTPPHANGVGDLIVTNPDAQAGTLPAAFSFSDPPPAPTTVNPSAGPTAGGTALTITGAGFVAGATVKIGGINATNVTVNSAHSITCTTPPHASGVGDLIVTNPDAQTGTLPAAFDFSDPPPAPTAVNPAVGPTAGGTAVTITGTGFVAGATVKICGINATNVTVNGAHSITCTTPPHASGVGDLIVTNPDAQTGTLPAAFGFSDPPPAPAAVNPGVGPTAGGTAVTITGTGFVAGATVKIGGINATNVTVNSANSITCTTPPHASGVGDLIVTNPDAQTGTLPAAFGFSDPSPAPTAVNPGVGPTAGGTAVTITGTGFVAGATVKIGGINATNVTVNSANSITCTTPPHASGVGDLIVTNPDAQAGTLPAAFSFSDPPPAPTTVNPSTGPTAGGTAVTITGTGFVAGATVKIGGINATNVTVNNANSITCTTPPHASGVGDLIVTNPDAQAGTLPAAFSFSDPPPAPTAVNPAVGPTAGGTAVTITGTGFVAGTTVKIGGINATNVTVNNANSITCTTPPHASGVGDLIVTNPDAQAGTLSAAFSFSDPPPVPTTVNPSAGPTAGGTAVTITGTGFVAGATVKIGGINATNVTVNSANSITCTTPPHASGVGDLIVTNSDAQAGTLPAAFDFSDPPPVPTAINPNHGPAAAPTVVTISGTGFIVGATVKVGGFNAINVTVTNANSITCTFPAHAPGTCDVIVTNPDGQTGTLPGAFTYDP